MKNQPIVLKKITLYFGKFSYTILKKITCSKVTKSKLMNRLAELQFEVDQLLQTLSFTILFFKMWNRCCSCKEKEAVKTVAECFCFYVATVYVRNGSYRFIPSNTWVRLSTQKSVVWISLYSVTALMTSNNWDSTR